MNTKRRKGEDRRQYNDPDYKGPERRINKDRRTKQTRRQYKRFWAAESVFVEFKIKPVKIGKVIDISKGGLCSRYIADDEDFKGSIQLKIYIAGNGFALDKVPIKIISVSEQFNQNAFSITKLKRCGVQFEHLTADQLSNLEYFLSNYTQGEV